MEPSPPSACSSPSGSPDPRPRTSALAMTRPAPPTPGSNARYDPRSAHTKTPRPRQNQLPRTRCLEGTVEPRNPYPLSARLPHRDGPSSSDAPAREPHPSLHLRPAEELRDSLPRHPQQARDLVLRPPETLTPLRVGITATQHHRRRHRVVHGRLMSQSQQCLHGLVSPTVTGVRGTGTRGQRLLITYPAWW